MSMNQVVTSVSVISSCLIGYQSVSLTNYETDAISSIANGSSCEIAGSFFKCNTNVAINGWDDLTVGSAAFIILTPSGTAGSQTITASYQQSLTDIVWVPSKNGYYTSSASVVRIIGGCFKTSSTQQERKWIYRGRDQFGFDFGYNINTILGTSYNRISAGTLNTGVGCDVLRYNTTGSSNSVVGYHCLYNNTTGSYNCAVGDGALLYNTTGVSNVAVGYTALYNNTTGVANVAIGSSSLSNNTTGSYNCAVGYTALLHNTTGVSNVAIGTNSLQNNTTGVYNVAIGTNSLQNNTTGVYNVAIGTNSLQSNTTGMFNVAIGANSLQSNTTGIYNVAIGAGAYFGLFNSNGRLNTVIGFNACYGGSAGNNNIVIGASSEPASGNASNSITLGDSGITVLRCAVTSITSLSDKRDKSNIIDISLGMEFINAMKPVEFDWDKREWYDDGARDGTKKGNHDFGFIAQDLQELQNKFDAKWLSLVYDENPEKLETTPNKLIPVIIKGMQEMYAEIQAIKEKINA